MHGGSLAFAVRQRSETPMRYPHSARLDPIGRARWELIRTTPNPTILGLAPNCSNALGGIVRGNMP